MDPELLLAQTDKLTKWLTPVWLITVGIAVGFLLSLAMLALFRLLGRIPGLNRIAGDPRSRRNFFFIAAAVLVLTVGGGLAWWLAALGSSLDAVLLAVALAAVACVALAKALPELVSSRRAEEIRDATQEGFLRWVTVVCIVAACFAGLGYAVGLTRGLGELTIVDDPNAKLASLVRYFQTGSVTRQYEIPVSPDQTHPGHPIPVDFYGVELERLVFQSNQRLAVAAEPITPELARMRVLDFITAASAREPQTYFRTPGPEGTIPNEHVSTLYVLNHGLAPADLTLTWVTSPAYPEAAVILWAAFSVVGLYLAYLVFVAAAPKVSAVATATLKSEISQPVFAMLLIVGGVLLLATIYVPYNTFGEDIKMYKDSGLTLIRVLGIFLAVWAASKSVAEEIEGRTALTVLSKPLGRRQFIFGKFAGISLSVGLLIILLGLWMILWTAYKPIYDAGETARGEIEWAESFKEAVSLVPGLVLAFLEAVVFVAISVAISTRIGILPNFLICFSIYVLGHLTPLIVQSNQVVQAFEPVVVFGQLIAIVLPVLDYFDLQAAITTDTPVPLLYLGWVTVYTILYGTAALLLALTFFEDRDLA